MNLTIEERNKLIMDNIGLVFAVVKKFNRPDLEDDLVGEGVIGLIEGIKRFDPSRGNTLSTYTSWWIRSKVLKYLRRNKFKVKVPTNWKIEMFEDLDMGTLDLDREIPDGGNFHDILSDRNIDPTDSFAQTNMITRLIENIIGELTEKEQLVMNGILEGKTQRALALDLSLSHQRIFQIHTEALAKLKKKLHRLGITEIGEIL